ncbi:uncharacterized protein UTRI_04396 [Ustilago trichophora]|uniref:Uncharacterized protein n=1 Tax=Ustilago trichophora TaxID=86804 RepID=A0A5C3EQE5_9BASI|nr:uncharacterized protein UTRI_04396 [Ustilago trichophora]
MRRHPEASKPSVNERLARAREQDLRRCRNIQAKLARAQGAQHSTDLSPGRLETQHTHSTAYAPSSSSSWSSSSRAGLMFLSSTEQAQKERQQRTHERQLKRQVAGPMPPESWRDDFDRLSIRRGVASHLEKRRLLDLFSTVGGGAGIEGAVRDGEAVSGQDRELRRRARNQRYTACAGLRFLYDSIESDDEKTKSPTPLLRDMALCVIADAINRPLVSASGGKGKGKERIETPEMDRAQIGEVLEYLPAHVRHRMLELCGRLAATDWPLSEWAAQALIDKIKLNTTTELQQNQLPPSSSDDSEHDWESSPDSPTYPSNAILHTRNEATSPTLDLSYSTISPRTITRMLRSTMGNGVALRMLSLAGWNNATNSSSSTTTSTLDSPAMLSIFSQLPNLEVLCLAATNLSPAPTSTSEVGAVVDFQRSAVFLRKLGRCLPKLKLMDLSFCRWVSADALLGVSWSSNNAAAATAWPRLENLLLVGCEAFADPRYLSRNGDGSIGSAGSPNVSAFAGLPADSYIAPWHSNHSQRALRYPTPTPTPDAETVYDDYYTGTVRQNDPFGLFNTPIAAAAAATHRNNPSRATSAATFGDYVKNAIQPAIISHMTPTSDGKEDKAVLMEYVRCPRSAGKVEMWQWQRARVLEGVRGRIQPVDATQTRRGWVEVWF